MTHARQDALFLKLQLQTHLSRPLLDFYRETLDLPVEAVDNDGFVVRTGVTTIEFLPAVDSKPLYHLAFNIPENRIEEAVRWLRQRVAVLPDSGGGQEIIEWPAWNAHSVYFRDAAGNILELIARHDLRNASQHAFGPEDWLCVSEFGVVVPDPHTVARELADTFGLPVRNLMQGFGAVGDDAGMFIVSAPGRPWMPVRDVRAQAFPAVVLLRHSEPVDLRLPGTDYRIVSRT